MSSTKSLNSNIHRLHTAVHHLIASQIQLLSARQPPPPFHEPFPPPSTFDSQPPPFDPSNPPTMGNDNKNKNDVHSEETILFLFLTFGILIVLIFILLLLGFQTYLSWRITHVFDEDSDADVAEKDFRRWDRQRKERKKALRALERGRSIRGSWGYGSGSGTRSSGSGRPKTDEEMGMSGARGSSMMLDKFPLKEDKKPLWSLKRWI